MEANGIRAENTSGSVNSPSTMIPQDDGQSIWSASQSMPCSIALVIWLLIPVMLIGIVLFGPSTTSYNLTGSFADGLLMFTYLLSLFGIGFCAREISKNNTKSKDKDHNKYSNICIAFIIILGFGDSLFNLTRFGDQLIWILNKSYASDYCYAYIFISMVENAFKCLCQLCILMFMMYQLDYPNMKKSPRFKFITSFLSISSLMQWLLILLQEIDQENKITDLCIRNDTNHSLNNFEKIEPFLYPLGIEFRLACFIELLGISDGYISQGFVKLSHVLATLFSKISKCLKQIFCAKDSPNNQSSERKTENTSEAPVEKNDANLLSFIGFRAIGICLVSVSMLIVFFQQYNEEKYKETVTLISECCEILLTLIILLHSATSLRNLGTNTHQKPMVPTVPTVPTDTTAEVVQTVNDEFMLDYFFLFIANAFLYIYCGLTLFGAAFFSSKNKSLLTTIRCLTIFASIIPIIQTPLQLVFIWRIRGNKKNSFGPDIDMWIILSFAIWLFDTFSAKEYDTNAIQKEVYKACWPIFGDIFIPLAIFFRFHSCVVFARIKSNAYHHQSSHSNA